MGCEAQRIGIDYYILALGMGSEAKCGLEAGMGAEY